MVATNTSIIAGLDYVGSVENKEISDVKTYFNNTIITFVRFVGALSFLALLG